MTDPFFKRRMIPAAYMGKKHLPEYKAAKKLWAEDRFGECVAASKSLLEKHDLQANLRMRTLLLLAVSTGDWYVAEDARLTCETLWHLTRKRYRDHPDEKVHSTLQSLRESLDELRELQEEEAREGEIEEVTLGFNSTIDDPACEDMVGTRPESPIFKENKIVRRMSI
ncbi:hypothetical protein KCU65_g8760, partial [Aureobasidium melanogenum]